MFSKFSVTNINRMLDIEDEVSTNAGSPLTEGSNKVKRHKDREGRRIP
jgi:hypothetical protein